MEAHAHTTQRSRAHLGKAERRQHAQIQAFAKRSDPQRSQAEGHATLVEERLRLEKRGQQRKAIALMVARAQGQERADGSHFRRARAWLDDGYPDALINQLVRSWVEDEPAED